jgi:hypothetical protein
MFNKLQLHEQENSTNKNQQSIIVVYIGLFTRPDIDANEHNENPILHLEYIRILMLFLTVKIHDSKINIKS